MNGFFEYLIANKAVHTGFEASSWEDAVLKGGEFMVKSGVAEPQYFTTMVKKVKEIGPYFILAPGIAMPHGRAEEGVIKTGYALVVLKEPVLFDDESDPVWLLIFMAAKDKKTHNEEAIVQIAELCDRDDVIEKIRTSKNTEEILEAIADLKKELEEQ